jgi:autotransporter-associated beta strand protein
MDGFGNLFLSGANSYRGPTIITAGATYLGSAGALPATTALTMTGGVLDFAIPGKAASSQTIASLSGSSGLIVSSDFDRASTLTINQASDTLFQGAITGRLGLVKQGTGRLTLAGSNSYTEGTIVEGGTLEITGSVSGSGVNVGAAGTLAGTGSVGGDVLIDGTLAPGVSGPGTLTLGGGALHLGPGSQTLLEIGGTNPLLAIDRIVGAGAITLDGTIKISLISGFQPALGDSFDLFDGTSFASGSFSTTTDLLLPALSSDLAWDTRSFTTTGVIAVIPEPNSATARMVGIAGLILAIRSRRSQRSLVC